MIQARRDSHLHKILEQIPFFGQSHDKQITKASYVFWSWFGEDNADTAISVLEDIANLIEI
ncbi:hypothetical protein [Endozoicomonas ascidiicola]|uniref:hypothetical protein n=1 Tax=Endozoicomonas ascidiicola TaxID=1698521 RepID=UPI0008341AE3|nr:hypothetical protein [Endozoicomonas ascidiicola]